MVIQHRQRVAHAAVSQGEAAFEVHLPQLVGPGALEALQRLVFERFLRVNLIVPPQNLGDGAGRRDVLVTLPLQEGLDLAAAPRGMGLAHRAHQPLHLGTGPARTMRRPP